MPKYVVDLERSAYQVATMEVEAKDELEAENIAVERMEHCNVDNRDDRVDAGIRTLELHADDESAWEVQETNTAEDVAQ